MRRFASLSVPILLLASSAYAADPGTVDASLPWSQRMADSILIRSPKPSMIESKNPNAPAVWSYSTGFCVRAVAQVGIMNPGPHPEADASNKYIKYGLDYLNAFIAADGTIGRSYDPKGFRLDDIAPGQLVLAIDAWYSTQLADSVDQERYLKAAKVLSEQFKTQPRVDGGGFWHKQIYPNQMWLDGIFMDCPFMARFGKLTNDPKWFDECATQILLLAQHAQDPKTGLLYHGWDASEKEKWADPVTGLSKNFWGRGIGWYLAGIVETLDYMPADHPKRKEIIAVLQKAAAGIAAVQDTDGLFFQVLDQATKTGNYHEASASSMFAYVLAKSARLGYIDAKYADVAKKAYAGVTKELITVDKTTGVLTLKDTCSVAGLGGTGKYRDGTFEYYISEPKAENDPKGMAPFILASLELEGKK